ncbi:MAG: hypothetical protein B6U76_11675 [Desulfurococcales archaeon ex4484_217_2]|nr:MAG: hypothetical protein B6U76_11675 [Desulfurococcales archaeon ex4484_217_2]
MGISHFAYSILRNTFIFKGFFKYLSWLEPYLVYSGIQMPLRRYVALISFITISVFIVSMPLFVIVHFIFLKYNLTFSIIASLILSFILTIITLSLMIYFPVFKAKSRLEALEARLPYIISYMTVLSYAGRNLESILAKLAEKGELFGMKEDATRMLRKISILGMDTARMLLEEAKNTPSIICSSLLESLAGIVETGKGLSEFLEQELTNVLRAREAKMREVLNSLSVFMELFVSLVVVMPLVLTIMLSIMATLGSRGLPINPMQLLFLIHFIITPTLAIIIVIMIDSLISKISA